MATTIYKVNGKNVSFDVDAYLENSTNIRRKDMPQVNMGKFLEMLPEIKKLVSVVKTKVRVDSVYPTQNEVNMEKVLRRLHSGDKLPDNKKVFIVSRDMNILDGHHRHIYLLMQDPTQKVDVYVVDMHTKKLVEMMKGLTNILNKPKAIHEYLIENFGDFLSVEGYGQQPPAASGGMGDVDFGEPTTADSEGRKGSGDIAGTQTKGKKKKPTYAEMKPALEHIKATFGVDLSYWYDALLVNEGVEVNQDGVIEKEDGIEWQHCINIPVTRKYFKMEKPFKVKTMEGITEGKAGDYLMRGVDGEMYPCDNDIFHKTYQHLNSVSEKK